MILNGLQDVEKVEELTVEYKSKTVYVTLKVCYICF